MKLKHILALIIGLLLIPSFVFATTTQQWVSTSTTNIITPNLIGGFNPAISVQSSATSTFSNGISITSGCLLVNNVCLGSSGASGVSSIAQTFGSAQTGGITLATTSQTTNGITAGLTITNSGAAFTFNPTISGTLTVGGGGTGQTTFTSSNLLYGAGTGPIQSVATGTISVSGGITATANQFIIGSGLTIGCTTATDSVPGCLSAADHVTFNGKQATGNYITALTGDVTASGPSSAAATLASVIVAGSCTNCNLTYDAKGRVTVAANGTGGTSQWTTSGSNIYYPASGVGNVGIGTTTPWANLSVAGASLGVVPLFTVSSSTATATSTVFMIDQNGNVGIATSSPKFRFDVQNNSIATTTMNIGTGTIPNITTTDPNSYANNVINNKSGLYVNGQQMLISPSYNLFIGVGAGGTSSPASYNAIVANTPAGNLSTAVGYGALGRGLTTGYSSVAVGYLAGLYQQTGILNTFIGNSAGLNNVSGSWNTYLGVDSGFNATGSGGTYVGDQSMFNNTGGSDNVILGMLAGNNATSGNGDILIGQGYDFPTVNASNALDIGNLLYATGLTDNNQADSASVSTALFGISSSTPWAKLSVAGNAGGATPLFTISSSSAAFATSTAFIIDSNGKVGIGTSSPSNTLAILGGEFVTSSSTHMNGIDLTGGCFSVRGVCLVPGSGSSQWTTSGSTINYPTGNVGIGSTSPWAVLSVSTTTASSASSALFAVASSTNATLFDVLNNGYVGIGTTTPYAPFSLQSPANLPASQPIFSVATSSAGSNIITVLNSGAVLFGTTTQYSVGGVPVTYAFTSNNGADMSVSMKNFSSTKAVVFRLSATSDFAHIDTVTTDGAWLLGSFGDAQWNVWDDTGSGVRILSVDQGITANAMTIKKGANNGGLIGIGSTTPIATLAVNATAGNATYQFDVGSSTATSFVVDNAGRIFAPKTSSSGAAQTGYWCYDANGQMIRDTALCITSAARFKQNIESIDSATALKEALALNPVSYFYKPDFNGSFQSDPNYSSEQVGFIADEVQKIDPRLVAVETGTTTFEGKTYAPGTVQTFRPEAILSVLTGAVKEQQKEIEALGGGAVKDAQDNWQWLAIGLLGLGFVYQQVQIRKLKK